MAGRLDWRGRWRWARSLVRGGGRGREARLLRALDRHYAERFRREWQLSEEPPHFFSHRIGFFQLGFTDRHAGPYPYGRAFFGAEIVRPGDRLLDIGCGDGFLTRRFLAPRCAAVDAVDVEPSAIATARRENPGPQIRYHCADAVSTPFPRADYDVIVWDGAIGHFPADTTRAMLAKIRAALAPGGVFVGSESLGEEEGDDHLQFFPDLRSLHDLLAPVFPEVLVREIAYPLPGGAFTRREGYWRCGLDGARAADAGWRSGADLDRGASA